MKSVSQADKVQSSLEEMLFILDDVVSPHNKSSKHLENLFFKETRAFVVSLMPPASAAVSAA